MKTKVYIGLVAAVGALAIVESVMHCRISNWIGYAIYLLVSVFASGFKLRLPGITCTVSAAFFPVLIGIVCLSAPETLIAACTAVLIQCVWHARRSSGLKVIFNVASVAIAVSLSAAVFHSRLLGRLEFEFPVRLLILGGAYFLANTGPVAGIIALTEGKSVWTVWRGSYLWSLPYYVVGSAAAGLFAIAKDHLGWQTALLFIPVTGLLYRACSLQIARIEDATSHAAALQHKNQELQAALTTAQKANEIKSRFLATFSHELRTPLNGIIGLSQLLHEQSLGPVTGEQSEALVDILQCSRHLLSLISDILDVTKIELGNIQFRYEDVSIRTLIEDAVKSLATVSTAKQLTVAVNISDSLERVKADPVRLRQVVFNYVSNAIKFAKPGGAIDIGAFPASATEYCIEVRDNGIGIRPEDLPRLFIEFGQLESPGKPQPGSGLGLAITKRIVEAQGGRVGVESVFGLGSRFYAVLPIVSC